MTYLIKANKQSDWILRCGISINSGLPLRSILGRHLQFVERVRPICGLD